MIPKKQWNLITPLPPPHSKITNFLELFINHFLLSRTYDCHYLVMEWYRAQQLSLHITNRLRGPNFLQGFPLILSIFDGPFFVYVIVDVHVQVYELFVPVFRILVYSFARLYSRSEQRRLHQFLLNSHHFVCRLSNTG